MLEENLPDWERVLSAAARLQKLLPEAILVGGTAAAIHAGHRMSRDADHVLPDLKDRFDAVLADLESVAGWQTARVRRPVMLLGSLDGIETGIRQLIGKQPLETQAIASKSGPIRIPTLEETLRIKAALILQRNATRDYLDFVALGSRLGVEKTVYSLLALDELYPQPTQSALQQLQIQLASPQPYDLEGTDLSEYRSLDPQWHDWSRVREFCERVAVALFEAA